jgi:hypothetical protein
MPDQAHIHQLLHLPPGLHVTVVNVRLGFGVSRVNVATGWVMIRKRPVNQVEVEVLQLKVLEALLAGGNHIALGMLVVPEFGGYPEILAAYA